MILVVTNINTQPYPINKLLFVSSLAPSQGDLAIARQVQVYWGEQSVGVHCGRVYVWMQVSLRRYVCVCVFLRESVCCVRYRFCIHCRFTSGWTEFHFPGWCRSPLLCPCQPQGSNCLCRNHIVEPVSGQPLNFTHTMAHSTSLNMPSHIDDIFPHFSRFKKKKPS